MLILWPCSPWNFRNLQQHSNRYEVLGQMAPKQKARIHRNNIYQKLLASQQKNVRINPINNDASLTDPMCVNSLSKVLKKKMCFAASIK